MAPTSPSCPGWRPRAEGAFGVFARVVPLATVEQVWAEPEDATDRIVLVS
jgi:hypothetical protein